jgi:hypothetical protein
VFSITPSVTQFRFWVAGVEYTKTTSQTLTLPNVTGLYLIVYDNTGTLQYKTSYLDFDAEAPVAHVYWNATTGAGRLAEQRHGVAMDWATHEYLHRTRGAAYASGLAISNYTTEGNGSLNSHAQFDLSGGTFFDEDLKFDITHSDSPTAPFAQDLQGPGRIPVAYHLGATGTWYFDTATDYAVKVGTIAKYNLNTAGTWTTPDITNTHYVAMWIMATNFISEPIVAIMGQRTDNKFANAKNNNTYASLDLTNFPSEEFRPLYRIIFRSANGYTNTPKAYIADVTDFRTVTVSGGASVTLAPNSFGNIAVTGQDPIIAKTVNDTLTLVAGTGITLTTDAATDSVTIASAGAGTVNSGGAGKITYYPSAGTTVDDTTISWDNSSGIMTLPDSGAYKGGNGTPGISMSGGKLTLISTGEVAQNTNTYCGPVTGTTDVRLFAFGATGGEVKVLGNGEVQLTPRDSKTIKASGDLDLTTGIIGTSTANTTIEIEPSGTGTIYLNGPLETNTTSGTPVDDATVVTWLKITVGASDYFLPLYQ